MSLPTRRVNGAVRDGLIEFARVRTQSPKQLCMAMQVIVIDESPYRPVVFA